VLPALLAALLVSVIACKKGKKQPVVEPVKTFDKQAMLINLADEVIMPAYIRLKGSLDEFSASLDQVISSGDLSGFAGVRTGFDKAYEDYQLVSLMGFGPGEEEAVRVNFNIFPCDTARVMSNLRSGSYNLSLAANIAAKGLPALEYLLWDSASVSPASALVGDSRRQAYMKTLVADLRQRTDAIIARWQGGYRSTFINSLGTDVGSSIGFVINNLNYELDYLKNSKIATPLGLRSGGAPVPDNCEAYYSGRSLVYARLSLEAIMSLYSGTSLSGNNGKGFDDYITHLGLLRGQESLAAAIDNQANAARQSLKDISDPLSVKVLTEKERVQAAYSELVQLLVLLKTDMPSGLGVVITYQDGDGD
jgi:uncharacterized protein